MLQSTFFIVKFNLTVNYKLIEISGNYKDALGVLMSHLALYSPAGGVVKAHYECDETIITAYRDIIAKGYTCKRDIMAAIAMIEEHNTPMEYVNVLEYHREIKMISDDMFDASWEDCV